MQRDKRLTPQEWIVVEIVTDGRTIKEVANKLNKSVHTVNNQIQSVYEKLDLPHNLNALTRWYVCNKYTLELPDYLKSMGVTLLLFLMVNTIWHNSNNEMRRPSRVRTRTEARVSRTKRQ